jgi:signal transduction histidine kinase
MLQAKSPEKRIFAFVILAFLSLTIYFIAYHYYSTLAETKKLTLERLHHTANLIALQIDGNEHQKILESYFSKDAIKDKKQDATYLKIHTTLKANYEASFLKSPVYTIIYDSLNKTFEFGVTSSEQPYFRHQYSTFPSYLIRNLNKGGVSEMYKDEFGTWLSAFAPIKNKNGQVVALVQVDEKFDDFIERIQNATFKSIFFVLVIFVVLIFSLLYFLKKILYKEQQIKEALSQAYLDEKEMIEKLNENEIKLKDYAQKLEKSNRELNDFAHIASHDLKAPIRGILSFVQLFERRNRHKFEPRDSEYFNFIKTNATQSLRLIESLLNYSKADKNLGEPVAFSLNDAVESAKSNLLANIEERNALIITHDLPIIEADFTLITQLFQNIINNGIKYNKSEQPTISIKADYVDNDENIYSIADNGIGIDEKYKQDVFAMFRRLHSAAEYEGTGIGLAFCVRIVETYGGKMWLDSEIGEGSTFYFTLPQATIKSKKEHSELVL